MERTLQILVDNAVLDQARAAEVESFAKSNRLGLLEAVRKTEAATDSDVARALAKSTRVSFINLKNFDLNPKAVEKITASVARKYMIIPIDYFGKTLTVAMIDPTNLFAIDDIKMISGCDVEAVVAPFNEILEAIENAYGSMEAASERLDEMINQSDGDSDAELVDVKEDDPMMDLLAGGADQAPIVKFVNKVLLDGIQHGASDIHFEAYENDFRIRLRIDGILKTVMTPPRNLASAITSRVKILSHMDIAEKRLPQDGSFSLNVGRKRIDFRVSTTVCMFGEKIVIRIMDQSRFKLDLSTLGFQPAQLRAFNEVIVKPYGIILVTGPTASGKTVTLYSAITMLNKENRNVMTAEEPVELNIYGINQVNVREKIGLTFASALRSFLRQDPDTILVGEMRDYETCSIAIKAALTGHLVFSTLHTNNAPATISRLIDMGVEPFMISASVLLTMSQRLVRKICDKCKKPYDPDPADIRKLTMPVEEAKNTIFYRGTGCQACYGNGYKGRIGIFEVMPINNTLRRLILEKGSLLELKSLARKQGMMTLREAGIAAIKNGLTSIEEVCEKTEADE